MFYGCSMLKNIKSYIPAIIVCNLKLVPCEGDCTILWRDYTIATNKHLYPNYIISALETSSHDVIEVYNGITTDTRYVKEKRV
jgi:hypothetical protein